MNKLIINLDKTVCMLTRTSQRVASGPFSELRLHVGGTNIKQVDSSKLLGVIINPHLTWEQHIDYVCKTVSRKIGLLQHLWPVLPHSALLVMYRTLILPHFDYCYTVWASASNTLITSVTKLQNRGARVLTSSGCYSHITPLYQRLNWITLRTEWYFTRLYWLTRASTDWSLNVCLVHSVESRIGTVPDVWPVQHCNIWGYDWNVSETV